MSRRPFGRQSLVSLGSPDSCVVPETPREKRWKYCMTCEGHVRHHRRGSLASRLSSFLPDLLPSLILVLTKDQSLRKL
jgi:hypothetical protein